MNFKMIWLGYFYCKRNRQTNQKNFLKKRSFYWFYFWRKVNISLILRLDSVTNSFNTKSNSHFGSNTSSNNGSFGKSYNYSGNNRDGKHNYAAELVRDGLWN